MRQVAAARNRTLSDAEIDDLFRGADIDGSGTIELEEFLQMQLKHRAARGAAAFARSALFE